jgi:hypothetical protein
MEKDLPVKVSYRIKRLIDKLNPITKVYDEKRVELIKEYGDKVVDEKTGEENTQVKDPEKIKQFMEKVNELQSVEEEVEFDKIDIEELGDVKIAPKDLVAFLFKD